MKQILVPTDFSREAGYAIDAARQLAHFTGAKVNLLHVLEKPSAAIVIIPDGGYQSGTRSETEPEDVFKSSLVDKIKEKLQQQALDLEKKGVSVSWYLKTGSLFGEIEKYTQSIEADIIILGSKGASGWKEIFMGSNAQKVIRSSQVPVLTVKNRITLKNFKTMVIATDNELDDSIPAAREFQKLLGLNCHFVKTYAFSLADRSDDQKALLEELASKSGITSYQTHLVNSPFVEDGVLEFAREHLADIIVMGTHGYKGLAHFSKGSIAEDVVNHTHIPVLSVKKMMGQGNGTKEEVREKA